jgi:signal transduction histidine kinase
MNSGQIYGLASDYPSIYTSKTFDAWGQLRSELAPEILKSVTTIGADGLSTGTSTVLAVAAFIATATFSSAGIATVSGISGAISGAAGNIQGVATVTGIATAFSTTEFISFGVAIVSGVSGAIAGAAGNAQGTATVIGISEAMVAVVVPGGHAKSEFTISFPYRKPVEEERPKRVRPKIVRPTPYELAKARAEAEKAELARLKAEKERLAEEARRAKAERERLAREEKERAAAMRFVRKKFRVVGAKGVCRGESTVIGESIPYGEAFAFISEEEFMFLALAA